MNVPKAHGAATDDLSPGSAATSPDTLPPLDGIPPEVLDRAFANLVRRRQATCGRALTDDEMARAQGDFDFLPEAVILDLAGATRPPPTAPRSRWGVLKTPERGQYTTLEVIQHVLTWIVIGGCFAWWEYTAGDEWHHKAMAVLWVAIGFAVATAVLWHARRWPFNK